MNNLPYDFERASEAIPRMHQRNEAVMRLLRGQANSDDVSLIEQYLDGQTEEWSYRHEVWGDLCDYVDSKHKGPVPACLLSAITCLETTYEDKDRQISAIRKLLNEAKQRWTKC